MSKTHTFNDIYIIKKMCEARGVNQYALSIAHEICNRIHKNENFDCVFDCVFDNVKLNIPLDICFYEGTGAEIEPIINEDIIIKAIIYIGKSIDQSKALEILSHELNHLVELLGKNRQQSAPKSEAKYYNILALMDMITDEESYNFIELVYNAERTEINAMVQETYSAIFNLENYKSELENTRAYKLAQKMQSCIEPDDYVKKIIQSVQKSIDSTSFDFTKTVRRIKFQGRQLMTKLMRLPGLIEKERKSFESYFNGIIMDKVLYENVELEKSEIGLVIVDPIRNLKLGLKRGRTIR